MAELAFLEQAISPVGIAVVHSIFNITTTLILLPFSRQLVKLAEGTIKTEPEKEVAFLDERLLNTPSIALSECNHKTTEMALSLIHICIAATYPAKAVENQKNSSETTKNDKKGTTFPFQQGHSLCCLESSCT